ncbi:MAG: tRNA pseudouridine(55) synthase TruB [Candidatus Gastranaerophilales bacterium]|nr:tRNA pseudouridine(55) synthase TruB [Candidatus Gastranaerophilales bacterium]
MFGFLNVNKPSGITSHKVISILRKLTGIKQIGHAGTLDPLASGVLPIAIGKASKLIDYLEEDKAYQVGMYLGRVSDTYDTEGKVEETGERKVTLEEIEVILPKFRGETKQVPPAFSAVHYNGKRLYELARSGNIPDDIPSRDIVIYKNELISFDYKNQILKLDIECSKGTYIRTIVNDIGQELGCGAVMFELIRTKSSGMFLKDALILSDNISIEDIKSALFNPLGVLKMQTYEINEYEYNKLLNGNKFKNRKNVKGDILLTQNNKVMSLAVADSEVIQPKKVLL